MSGTDRDRRALRPGLAFLLPLSIALLCLLGVRICLGFQFPVPWMDETQFVSPAFHLARTGSMFDSGLNPDRLDMAMPPGYSVLLAASFKLFGYSYALVRWISLLCMALGLFMAGRIAWVLGGRYRNWAAWAVGIAFCSPALLLSSNVGRMEALVCCLILAALSAGIAGRPYVMGAIVVLTATVHFNAVYFVPAVAADFAARLLTRRLRLPGGLDWLALAASAASILCYAILIACNLPGFTSDMRHQFAIKAFFRVFDPTHPVSLLWCAAGLLAVRILCTPRMDGGLLAGLFGAGFVAMAHYGVEPWYDYGQPLGFALLGIAAFDGLSRLHGNRLLLGRLGAGAAIAMTLAMAIRVTPSQAMLLPTRRMFAHDFVPHGDIKSVRRFIATLHRGDQVDFGFTGMENFFLADLDRAGASWTRLNHSLFQPQPLRRSDWRVSCDSSDLSPEMLKYDLSIHRQMRDTGCEVLPGLDPG